MHSLFFEKGLEDKSILGLKILLVLAVHSLLDTDPRQHVTYLHIIQNKSLMLR